jgi:hypothetical protein
MRPIAVKLRKKDGMLIMNLQKHEGLHPMNIISKVAQAMQEVLTSVADELARETGFIKRQRKVTGSSFVQSLVFGWMAESDATLDTLSQSFANVNVTISRQGLNQRFTPEACDFLEAVLRVCLSQTIATIPQAMPLLREFEGVYVMDSTVIVLPSELRDIWKGCNGSALKLSVCWEVLTGELISVYLHNGSEHDGCAPMQTMSLPPNTIRLSDLGFFKLDVFEQHADNGSLCVMRYKVGTVICDEAGHRLDLLDVLETSDEDIMDRRIRLGAQHQIPCRLIAQRVPEDKLKQRQEQLKRWESRKQKQASALRWALLAWSICITNASRDQLSAEAVMLMIRVRWQIELLFELWKDSIDIDDWRSEKPYRILGEVYAKMIACVLQHWLMLVGGIHALDKSLKQATNPIHNLAWALAFFLDQTAILEQLIAQVRYILRGSAWISYSSSSPPTFQRIEQQLA